jgi:uncharacterized protein YecT (DUF1311 family)
MSDETVERDDCPEWERAIHKRFTTEENSDDKGACLSSLISVHKLTTPDRLYDLNLLRMTQVANERTVRELGPLPPGGLPLISKRQPKMGNVIVPTEEKENEEMKLRRMILATMLIATTTMGTRANPTTAEASQRMADAQRGAAFSGVKLVGNQKEPEYRKDFDKCMDAANGVTVDIMNCINEEFDYQDKRLNSVYQSLHKVLTPTKWSMLRDEQRIWLAGRDNCEVDNDIRGGTAEMLVRADCALRKTALRADELEALLMQQSH